MAARAVESDGQPGLRRKAALLAIGLVLIALVINSLFGDRGVLHLIAQREKTSQLEREIDELRNENLRLAHEITALKTDAQVVERVAREELGLAASGETVFLIREQTRGSDGH
jgi:cell division protein FtsB